MHLKLIAARTAAVVAMSCAVLSITSLVVFADANPNNHGHHYGQLKHQHPPVTQPPTAPVTKPKPPAVSTGVGSLAPAIAQATSPGSGGATPLAPVGGAIPAPQSVVAAVPAFHDPNLWVVEALLPALLIIWLILLASSRALQKRKPAAGEQSG